jgi:D-alanyl-D-alanine-carboxypeptidase/D-alanyl-D-alanine-endopeptidase
MMSKKLLLRSAAQFSSVVLLSGTLSAQSWPSDSALKATLQQRLGSKSGVGIVVATLEKGKPPRIVTVGSSGSKTLLDGNTVFEIGSVTKVFTSALLADMVQRGEVRLDDPISKYLPATVRVPSRGGRQITLLELATQSSGLPRLPNNLSPADMMNPYADYTVKKLYDFLSSYELPRDVGSQFEYSNLGVGLLGHVLSLRAGKSYEALLTERILEPLGMRHTRIVLTPEMREHLATGHNGAGTAVPNWDLPTLAGAGALRSTANDMLKFLAANLDSLSGPVARALALGHTPRREAGSQMKIGLGWITAGQIGTPLTWHNGETGGYHSFIGFDREAERGVVILANLGGSIDDIGFHTLDERIPVAPPPREHKEVAVDPRLFDVYVGVYQLAPTFEIAITKEGASLFAQATGQSKYQIFPESETDFFLKMVDAQISFVKDASGKVDQLVLHQGGGHLPGKRVR